MDPVQGPPAGGFEARDDPGRRITLEEVIASCAMDSGLNRNEAQRGLMLQMELQDTLASI